MLEEKRVRGREGKRQRKGRSDGRRQCAERWSCLGKEKVSEICLERKGLDGGRERGRGRGEALEGGVAKRLSCIEKVKVRRTRLINK